MVKSIVVEPFEFHLSFPTSKYKVLVDPDAVPAPDVSIFISFIVQLRNVVVCSLTTFAAKLVVPIWTPLVLSNDDTFTSSLALNGITSNINVMSLTVNVAPFALALFGIGDSVNILLNSTTC